MGKKLISLITACSTLCTAGVFTALCAFGSCAKSNSDSSLNSSLGSILENSTIEESMGNATASFEENSSEMSSINSEVDTESSANSSEESSSEESSSEESSSEESSSEESSSEESSSEESSSDNSSSEDSSIEDDEEKAYFTEDECLLFMENVGYVLPYAEGTEYMVQRLPEEAAESFSSGVTYVLWNYDSAALDAYIQLFTEEEGYQEYNIGYPGAPIMYKKGDAVVMFNYPEGEAPATVIAGVMAIALPEIPDIPDVPNIPDKGDSPFTDGEWAIFHQYLGFAFPYAEGTTYDVQPIIQQEDGRLTKGVVYNLYNYDTDALNAYIQLFTEEEGYQVYGMEMPGVLPTMFEKGDAVVIVNYPMEGTPANVMGMVRSYSEEGGTRYTQFTEEEKALFEGKFGFVIPFIENVDYEVKNVEYPEGAVEFSVYNVTEESFEKYLENFTEDNGYSLESDITIGSDRNCEYTKDRGYTVSVSYISLGSIPTLTVTVSSDWTIDFTEEEKALFKEKFGFVIPFIKNTFYYVEKYEYYEEVEDQTKIGVRFSASDNTYEEFKAYLELYNQENGYEIVGETPDFKEESTYGEWYFHKNDYVIEVVYLKVGEDSRVNVFVYKLFAEDQTSQAKDGIELITNEGKGLPEGENGVYEVDFTEATDVKDVMGQGSHAYGCPTTGRQLNVLVIPVEFSDSTASSKGYTTEKIETAFNGKITSGAYSSVRDYYYQSSFGKLDVQFTVLEDWFMPQYESTHYAAQTMRILGMDKEIGDQIIMEEALAYLESYMDLSQFDSDGNDKIDAVVMINTLDISSGKNFYWAYKYTNIYGSSTYDEVSAYDYIWAPYQFLHDTGKYSEYGKIYDENLINTYTYIHEFGHILGADDYYDTAYLGCQTLEGKDVMDATYGDHNAYTKFHYGWLTNSRLVTAEKSVTLTLEDFSKNGDTIIIANNWDAELGIYQEYYLLVYYTNNGLNAGEKAGYFDKEGVLVYHINASLQRELDLITGEYIYNVYNRNTHGSSEYGTWDNLISYVKSADGGFVYEKGDTMPTNIKDDQSNEISYTFEVVAITKNEVTITFTKL